MSDLVSLGCGLSGSFNFVQGLKRAIKKIAELLRYCCLMWFLLRVICLRGLVWDEIRIYGVKVIQH